MLEGEKKFIHTHEIFFSTNSEFRDLNLNIKRSIVHSIFLLSLQYCRVVEICTDFFVKMRRNISKQMVERMKRKESLYFGTKRKSSYTINRPRGEEEKEDGCNSFW